MTSPSSARASCLPKQKGIFFIRADGSGLRRLGDASRIPAHTASLGRFEPSFRFSPNGRLVDFTDMGPGSGGEDAAQVFTLDVETGKRTQVTHLPPAPFAGLDGANTGSFLNDQIIGFSTTSNPDGLNPDGKGLELRVNIDDGEIKVAYSLANLNIPGVPVNSQGGAGITEVFINDGTNLLQLTNFRRVDTASHLLSVDGERVFLTASVESAARHQ